MPKAALFDLDGTLLDSVDLHAVAWHEAMIEFGHDVTFEAVRSQIGKGGDKLIPVFLSKTEQQNHGKDLEAWRGARFKSRYLPAVLASINPPQLAAFLLPATNIDIGLLTRVLSRNTWA